MARRTVTVKLEDRGVEKTFFLTEMSAVDAENWALELFFLMAGAGVEVPDDVANRGLGEIAKMGLDALKGVDFYKAKPLLDRLMDCVQIIPDPNTPYVMRKLDETDIDDVKTRLLLKKEVFKLHTDFLKAAKP